MAPLKGVRNRSRSGEYEYDNPEFVLEDVNGKDIFGSFRSDVNKDRDIVDKTDHFKSVSYFSLFKYSTCCEKVCIFLGIFSALVSGLVLPIINVLYGEFTNMLVDRQFPTGVSTKTVLLELFGGGRLLVNASLEERQKALHEDSNAFGIGCVTLSVVQFITGAISVYLLNNTAFKQIARIRKMFFKSILSKDMTWFETKGASTNFGSRVTDNLDCIEKGIGEAIAIVTYMLMTLVGGVMIAFLAGWKLTFAMLSIVPILFGSTVGGSKMQSSLTRKELKSYGLAASVAEEVFTAIRTVVSFNGQEKEIKRYEDRLKTSKDIGIKKGMISGIGSGVLWFVTYCSYAIAFSYGVRLILWSRQSGSYEYTPGILIIVFFGVMMGATNMGYAAAHFETFAVARGAASNIFEIMEHESVINSLDNKGIKKNECKGEIEFRNVRFQYPARSNVKVLKGLNLKVNAGEMVAIVGGSGGGKSTILELVQRKYDPVQGDVFLDGENLKSLNVSWLRQQMGVVGQEPILFATTIRENIQYGSASATDDDITEAAKAANAHDFIMKLMEGYSTVIGQKGSTLSGGQKQRIAVARALVRNPKILLLDEATSALDATSEQVVQAALDRAAVGRTTLIVTHKLSTITQADRIIVLANGVVAEQGTHDELVELKGIYSELLKSQQETVQAKPKTPSSVIAPSKRPLDSTIYEEPQPVGPGPRTRDSFVSTYSGFSKKIKHEVKERLEQSVDVPFKQILKWNSPEWHLLSMGALASVIAGGALPVVCILFGDLYGVLSLTDDTVIIEKTNLYAILLVVIGLIAGFGIFSQSHLFCIAGIRMTTRLRVKAFSSVIYQEIGWFDDERNRVGAICTRLSQDALGVQGAVGSRIGVILQAMSTMAIASIVSFFYTWKLTLVTVVAVPFVFSGVYMETILLGGANIKEKKSMEAATKIATEVISNIKVVSSLGKEMLFYEKYSQELSKGETTLSNRALLRGAAFALGQTAPFFGYALSLWYGGTLVADENLHYQDVIKVSELLIFGAWTLGQSAVFAPSFSDAKLSAGRLQFLFKRIPKVRDGDVAVVPDFKKGGEIAFSKVSFAYPTRLDSVVLTGLDLTIRGGESIALVGSSGCGKSTIVQLLQRYYDPQSGSISLENIDISKFKLSALRNRLGLVSQEPVLFDKTIRENIAYGDNSREVPDSEIIEAAKASNIHAFISTLPLGYDTRLGTSGTQLSGGQKQRIAIARALIRNPQILLLDEATSALDPQSEKIVQEALDNVSTGRTTITIGHRLGAIMNADVIYVLDKGKVVECGNHDKLMETKGKYYEMHRFHSTTNAP